MSREVDLLKRMAEKLDAAGIPYAVTGSLASGIHGEARASNDVDIIIAPTIEQLRAFCASLEVTRYYVSAEGAEEAFRLRRMFNVIEPETGAKADLIVRKDGPFGIEAFRRRRPGQVEGGEVFLISPEDSILSKLEWAKRGGSDRQVRDAVGVAAVQGEALDVEYLKRWAAELDVEDLLREVLDEAERTR